MILFITDINECDDPAIAARCVENAECCNLPAHFLCKCKAGFKGDGEVQCLGKFQFSFKFNYYLRLWSFSSFDLSLWKSSYLYPTRILNLRVVNMS